MQHYTAFYLGLHCLSKYQFRGFQYTFTNKRAIDIIQNLQQKALSKEFLAIKRAISLNETFVLFVEITTGETRHIQQIYIGEPSMQHCPRICIF